MIAVAHLDVAKPTFPGYADQIDFQQGGQMCRVGIFLKRIELVLYQQRCLAQQAELIRGGDHEPATGFEKASHLAQQITRVFQMFDGFDGYHDVGDTVAQRIRHVIQIHADQPVVVGLRKAWISDQVTAEVMAIAAVKSIRQVAAAAADVHQQPREGAGSEYALDPIKDRVRANAAG